MKYNSLSITFIELGSGLVFLTFLLPVYIKIFPDVNLIPSIHDLIYLTILALCCTTFPYVLSLKALKHISAFTSTFTVNLEPIYGIIMAIIIFQENKELNSGFYLGTSIILVAIFIHPLLRKKFDKTGV